MATERNLYQRLCDIAGDVTGVEPTGRTAQGVPTMSIKDVEGALRFLFARHNVVSGFEWIFPPSVAQEYDRGGRLWQGHIKVWFLNPDKPEERLEIPVYEHGSNPSAVVSFALKRVYRALFHLADEGDEGQVVSRDARQDAPKSRQDAPGRPTVVKPDAKVEKPVKIILEPAPASPTSELPVVAQAVLNPPLSETEFSKELKRLGFTEARAMLHANRFFGRPTNLEDLTGEQRAALVAELEGVVLSGKGKA